MTIKEFFSFKANRFFWVNIIAMVVVAVLIVFGALKGLDIYTRHGQAVVVPDVKGMSVSEAEKMFRDQGLTYVVSVGRAESERRTNDLPHNKYTQYSFVRSARCGR